MSQRQTQGAVNGIDGARRDGVRRALLSVSNPEAVTPLAFALKRFGWEVWASEGTASALERSGVSVRRLSELTGISSLLGGRLKTLHPRVFGGVLARERAEDRADLEALQAPAFDLVVVEFYPFEEAARSGRARPEELVELIDIGGPALVRAAAKNHQRVTVVCHPGQYPRLLEHLERTGGEPPGPELRRRLAVEAFERTAAYDAAVARALSGGPEAGVQEPLQARAQAPLAGAESGIAGGGGREHGGEGGQAPAQEGVSPQREAGAGRPGVPGGFPAVLRLEYRLWRRARYGENPHQQAAIYRSAEPVPSVVWGQVLQGKELSFNNVADACAAWELALELADRPAAVAIKHGTPCGVAVADTLLGAYQRAYEADPVSIFGGVVALTQPVDRATAQAMTRTFLQVVVAPKFTPEAREVLGQRPNLRLIEVGSPGWPPEGGFEVRSVPGGLLVQTPDRLDLDEQRLRTVTKTAVPEGLWPDLRFAWRVVKHARSNAIVVAAGGQTVGIGAGQVSRIDAARHALQRAGERARGAVLASDGFFPFSDVVELAAQYGIAAIIQPGGSVRDNESIAAADRAGIAMVFTGVRHFRH